jgi:hypothetical protein
MNYLTQQEILLRIVDFFSSNHRYGRHFTGFIGRLGVAIIASHHHSGGNDAEDCSAESTGSSC